MAEMIVQCKHPQARFEGFQACRDATDGEAVRCPYDMGSREGQAWQWGWNFYTDHQGELET